MLIYPETFQFIIKSVEESINKFTLLELEVISVQRPPMLDIQNIQWKTSQSIRKARDEKSKIHKHNIKTVTHDK